MIHDPDPVHLPLFSTTMFFLCMSRRRRCANCQPSTCANADRCTKELCRPLATARRCAVLSHHHCRRRSSITSSWSIVERGRRLVSGEGGGGQGWIDNPTSAEQGISPLQLLACHPAKIQRAPPNTARLPFREASAEQGISPLHLLACHPAKIQRAPPARTRHVSRKGCHVTF